MQYVELQPHWQGEDGGPIAVQGQASAEGAKPKGVKAAGRRFYFGDRFARMIPKGRPQDVDRVPPSVVYPK
jgi:hypothetical protein